MSPPGRTPRQRGAETPASNPIRCCAPLQQQQQLLLLLHQKQQERGGGVPPLRAQLVLPGELPHRLPHPLHLCLLLLLLLQQHLLHLLLQQLQLLLAQVGPVSFTPRRLWPARDGSCLSVALTHLHLPPRSSTRSSRGNRDAS